MAAYPSGGQRVGVHDVVQHALARWSLLHADFMRAGGLPQPQVDELAGLHHGGREGGAAIQFGSHALRQSMSLSSVSIQSLRTASRRASPVRAVPSRSARCARMASTQSL